MEKYIILDSQGENISIVNNEYLHIYIPTDFYNDFGNGNYEVELIINQQLRGITENVGYWTIESDISFSNVYNSANDCFNIIQYRDGALTSDVRVGENIRGLLNGRPTLLKFKFTRSDGVKLLASKYLMILKFKCLSNIDTNKYLLTSYKSLL